MKNRNLAIVVLLIFLALPVFGEGIKVSPNNFKRNGMKYKSALNGAKDIRLFSNFEGKHFIIGYYSGNRIKILNIPDSTYLDLVMQTRMAKENIVREARIPFIVYELFSGETYATLLTGVYSRYGIDNPTLDVVTYPVMTAAGIIIPILYTSNHEISYGEFIHSFTSNIYFAGISGATNYLFSEKMEPLTVLLSSMAGNVMGYWMAKEKRYTPGQALLYDEILQKTSYISLSASIIYQDSTQNGRIVAGSFLGATAIGAVGSYLLADRYNDIKVGDIFMLNGLSNSMSASLTLFAGSFVHNMKVLLPVSYGMFIPGYYLGGKILKTGHITAQDGVIFNLGIYAGYLLGGAIDAIININDSGYNKTIFTSVGGLASTIVMYNWLKKRTVKDVRDTEISMIINPIPEIVYNKSENNRTYSFKRLITINF